MITPLCHTLLRITAIVAATVAIAACSSHSSEPQPKPAELMARFEPRILDNGTKLFTYTVQLPRQVPQPGRSRRSEPAPVHQWASHLLLQNGFCREGFVTLDHYQAGARATLRGECREGATDTDRQRF